MNEIYAALLVMGFVSYLIRMTPFVLIRKPINNVFIQSFLYYVPYVTLAVMTVPAIIHATQTPLSGLAALIIGTLIAFKGASLMRVATVCVLVVYIIELIVV